MKNLLDYNTTCQTFMRKLVKYLINFTANIRRKIWKAFDYSECSTNFPIHNQKTRYTDFFTELELRISCN